MAYHYLIDGYNLLYALPEMPAGSWQQKRSSLLIFLQQKRPQGNNPVTVVFDSREGLGDKVQVGPIAVIFTAGETADEHLSAMVRKLPNPRNLVVVSNDRGLQALVRGTGARCLSATDFLKPAPASPPQRDMKERPPPGSQEITE